MGAGEFALLIPVLAIFFGGMAVLSRTVIGKAIARRIGGEAGGEVEDRLAELEQLRVDYVAPTPLGPELELRARVREAVGRKVVVDVTLLVGGAVTARGEVVAVRLPETMAQRTAADGGGSGR